MRRTLPIALLMTVFAAAPGLAQDQASAAGDEPLLIPARNLAVNYDFNLGGFQLGSGRLRVTFTEDTYEARTDLRTDGLAEWLFQSRYLNTSKGMRNGADIYPEDYTSDFQGADSDDYQIVQIGYDETTPYLIEADPSYGRRLERFPVTEEQRQFSYDPLNAAIHLITGMSFSEDQPCGERVRIFDGRRRYDIVMSHAGEEDIRVRGGEVWDGEAIVCELNYEEVAGFKPQPEDDELPRPPMTMWMGYLEDEGFYIPLRVSAPTPIGGVVMVASFMRVDHTEVALNPSDTLDLFGGSSAPAN